MAESHPNLNSTRKKELYIWTLACKGATEAEMTVHMQCANLTLAELREPVDKLHP